MERELTDGDAALGSSPMVRLVRAIGVFAVFGLVVVFGAIGDATIPTKILAFITVLIAGVFAWGYLEARNIVIMRAQANRSLGWRIAALGVHPAMVPVYLIALPIAGYFAVACIKHANAEQAGTGQPATRPVFESKGGDKPQPEAEGRSR